MRACRAASVAALGALLVSGSIAACRDAQRPDVPSVTTARPSSSDPVLSGPAGDTSLATASPAPIEAGAAPVAAREPPIEAAVLDLPARVEPASDCREAVVAVVRGTASAHGDTLKAGDVLIVRDADPFEVNGSGTIVTAIAKAPSAACAGAKRQLGRAVIRAASTPEVSWGKGAMRARLQVGDKEGSLFYLGRLEGTSPVAEHAHPGTWEILAAIDAEGTFVLDGRASRLAPRQVVVVPPDAKHEWRPDPGSKLVAVQMYWPPGPEQRFLALAAADEDAGTAEVGAAKKR